MRARCDRRGSGGNSVLPLPGPGFHIGRHDAQLSYFLVGASRRHNHGIESGLQSPPAAGPSPAASAAAGDWPSYNKTLTSERYSELDQIDTQNVGKLKVLCTYDVDQYTAFESGLIMVDNALIGTTQIRYFLPQPGDLRRELANARGLSPRSYAGQSRRRLHGRRAVSRHPGRAGAGL
jgi:hypothetical protein